MSIGWTRVLVGGAVVSVLLAAGTVITMADTGGVIFACVNNANGDVRIVAQQVSCKPNETSAHWNVVGPQGPAGPQGPQGPAGPQGPPGQSGPQSQVVGVVTVHTTSGNQVFEAIQFTTGLNVATTTTGHAVIEPGSFTKIVDKNSPELVGFLTRGTQLELKVELCNSITMLNGAPKCSGTPYATYQYGHARLSKISDTTPPAFTDVAEEDVVFESTDITFTADGHTVMYDARTGITS